MRDPHASQSLLRQQSGIDDRLSSCVQGDKKQVIARTKHAEEISVKVEFIYDVDEVVSRQTKFQGILDKRKVSFLSANFQE
jgi:hypothetical protein